MPCLVEKDTGEIYKNCVLDIGKPDDCRCAEAISHRGQCEFWTDDEIKLCPHCGNELKP